LFLSGDFEVDWFCLGCFVCLLLFYYCLVFTSCRFCRWKIFLTTAGFIKNPCYEQVSFLLQSGYFLDGFGTDFQGLIHGDR
jgi:hypothetical protein